MPRFLLLLFCFGLVMGPGVSVVAQEVDSGRAEPGAFAFLLAVLGLICRPLMSEAETAVFGFEKRPWLGGRLPRWQRLVLPYSSALYVTQGITVGLGGAIYLLTAPTEWNAFHLIAVCFNVVGGALLWFGFARLLAGALIIRSSGLWAAPQWAWRIGIAFILLCSTLGGLRSLWTTMQLSPVI